MSLLMRIPVFVVFGAMSVARVAFAQSADETEIKSVAVRQGEAWTRHDAKAYAALFSQDCDVVNVLGWWWKGRAELESKLSAGFAQVFAQSKLTITEVDVRFLSSDVVVAHARWTMSGAKTAPGVPEPRAGLQTLVFTNLSGRWLIRAFQNTNSVPEQPFPTGRPSSDR